MSALKKWFHRQNSNNLKESSFYRKKFTSRKIVSPIFRYSHPDFCGSIQLDLSLEKATFCVCVCFHSIPLNYVGGHPIEILFLVSFVLFFHLCFLSVFAQFFFFVCLNTVIEEKNTTRRNRLLANLFNFIFGPLMILVPSLKSSLKTVKLFTFLI